MARYGNAKCFLSELRRQGRHVPLDPEEIDQLPGVPERQENIVMLGEMTQAMQKKLSPNQHRAFTEVILYEGSYEDVGAAGGDPVGTVKSRVNRSRRKLLKAVGEGLG